MVVASGDHISLIVELDRGGIEVCVVSKRRALSRAVSSVAPVVWYLDEGWVSVPVPA